MAIAANISIPQFDGVLINRLLRRDSVNKAVQISKLALLGFSALIMILILHSALTSFLKLNSLVTDAENQLELKLSELTASLQSDKPQRAINSEILKGRGLFGEVGVKPVSAVAANTKPASAKDSPLNLSLIGTFLTAGQSSYAIIEHKKDGAQEPFNKGDKVFDQAELVAIFTDRIEINRNGQIETLRLDDTPDSSDSPSSVGANTAGDLVVVAENDLNEALDNLPLLLTQARAVPYFKDGQSVGLRLFAIKTGSLYERIGLKNGDILKSINGNSLGDITQAVKLFERLREERSISLDIERNRQEQSFRYEIK